MSDQSLHVEGVKKTAIETGHARLMVAGIMFALAFTVIGGRMIELAVLNEAEPRSPRQKPSLIATMNRADITDRSGVVMATSLPTVDLYANAAKIIDPEDSARQLVKVLPELSYDDVLDKMSSRRSFVYLEHNLPPAQQYDVNSLGIPGLYFLEGERRVYPQGSLAAHIIGMTDLDNKGIAGLEKTFDDQLGRRKEPLTLSLDLRVQAIMRAELARAIDDYAAMGATGMVMDVDTGEIIAMVSLPDFDPNAPHATPPDTRFNRATLGVYEMGSTFKLFNTAAGLDSGTVTLKGGYDATEPMRRGRFTISDFHPEKRWLSVPEILIHSSNIGSAKMALAMGGETQKSYLDRLGMLDPVTLELPEIGAPLVPSPWREINTITISYGHGLAVTPVHVVSGVSALVNGGLYRSPTLLRRDPQAPEIVRQVLSEDTSRHMRKLMRMVVTDGTGNKADVPGYGVGGKTGTAEKLGAGGNYKKKSLLTSFIAIFPSHQPRYAVLAMIDEPKGTKETFGFATAGWNAAPVVGRVIAKSAPLLGVAPAFVPHPDMTGFEQGGRAIAAVE